MPWLVDARIIVENLVVDCPVFCPGDPADTEIPTHLAQTDYSPQGLYCILYMSCVFTTEAVLFPAGAIFCPDGAALYVAGAVLCTTGWHYAARGGLLYPTGPTYKPQRFTLSSAAASSATVPISV